MLDLDNLIKVSLINKDNTSLKVFRNLKTDIMVFKTQKNAPVYDEASELKIIQKYAAKMEDAEKQYLEAGREDLVSECREELEILRKLLPEPISENKIHTFIQDYCIDNGFHQNETIVIPKKSMGIVIKAIKEQFPIADGKMISGIVKQYIVD
jgi:uncharacterized protein YqeY